MTGPLRRETRQRRPVASLETEVFLNLLRTADALLRGVEQALESSGLSHTQYNVLRILRGAGREGLACREIGERMLTRDPDITRLLDRLEARGLVGRARGQPDRRVVRTHITREGLGLLRGLDAPMEQVHRRQLGSLGRSRLRTLVGLLERVRARAP